MPHIEIGGLAYARDPNDPEMIADAIAGGFVYQTYAPEQKVRCVRNWRGQLHWSELVEDQVEVAYPAAEARTTAANLYLLICRQVGRDKRTKHDHLRLLDIAHLAAKVSAGQYP